MRFALFLFVLLISTLVFSTTSVGQTCSGSLGAPVVNYTFGAGTTFGNGPELPSGTTNLTYFDQNCGGPDSGIMNGAYTIATSLGASCKGGTWHYIGHDHTGDPNGYFMIINASETPNTFFIDTVKGNSLCPNTTYFFGAWVMNILRDLPQTQGYIEPDVTFSIETADGTVLKTINTDSIKATDEPTWIQYGALFTTPANGPDLVVKISNIAPGGFGNDLALDDITFSPCGPLIQTGFGTVTDRADRSNCFNDNLSYTLVAQQMGYDDPTYQWQVNKNDGAGWINIPGATSTQYNVAVTNAATGLYQYRIGVLNKNSIGSESCRIFSDPLNINVYPTPSFDLPANTSACNGNMIRLQSTGGDSYLWTGPNNFTSIEDSPVITFNADPSIDGNYTVKVTRNNCPFFATTTVKVYPPVTIEQLGDIAICAGNVVQLNVKTTNATTFKWYPSTGLDHDDTPNPVASPATTTTYKVEASNTGCPDVAQSTTFTITVNKNPVADAGKPIKMFEGQHTKLSGTVGGDNITYFWTPATYLDDPKSLTPVTSAPSNITYQLNVESGVDCGTAVSSVFIRVYKTLAVVNTFTPNGDGVNDYWDIKNIDDYPNSEISVYNRYGQKVFQSIGYSKPWDGNYNGEKLPTGTYYYIVDLKDDNLPKQAGWVLIVR